MGRFHHRYQVHSLILISQLQVTGWRYPIGDPAVAGGILSRQAAQRPAGKRCAASRVP